LKGCIIIGPISKHRGPDFAHGSQNTNATFLPPITSNYSTMWQ